MVFLKLNSKIQGVLVLSIATFFWGGTFTYSKILIGSFSPMALIGIRCLLMSSLIFLMFYKKIIKGLGAGLKNPTMWGFAIMNFLALVLQTIGLEKTTASNAGFITAISVILVPFIKLIHYNGKTSKSLYLALTIAMIGMYIISFGFNIPKSVNTGDVWVFACSFAVGYYIVFMEKLSNIFSAPLIIFLAFFITGVLSTLGSFVENSFSLSGLSSWPVARDMILLVTLGSIVPYLMMVYGQKRVSAQLAALIYILEPIFAMLIAWVALNEQITLVTITGGLLVIVSLFIGVIYSEE